ncbi:MAG TPA: DUF3187 family protein [Gemmatimonadales bacterium]
MVRTYAALQRVVKGAALGLILGATPGLGQGLPAFAPLNPVATSRSGLYFQPYREPAPRRWVSSVQLDYGSIIEYNQLSPALYVLDTEILRLTFGASRDLGRRTFISLSGSAQGAYSGFMDGFLDWYHGALGIRVSEREQRPQDRFLYSVTLPDGRTVARSSTNLFLGDMRVGLGVRLNQSLQTMLSLTLPTSTGPEGYGRGVASLSALTTLRTPLEPRWMFEGSLGIGVTPTQGELSRYQRTTFLALSSGVRYRIWGSQALYGNVFFHSPYYQGTSLPALDRRELSLDFGWVLESRAGGEWRVGLTEDLEPGGPGVDLVLRVGRSF